MLMSLYNLYCKGLSSICIKGTIMPKLKTCKGAAKRFKLTKSGKIKFKKAFKSHILEHKSSKMKRQARNAAFIHPADHNNVRQLLPYG